MTATEIDLYEKKLVSSLPAELVEYIKKCRLAEHSESYLIAVLQKIQSHYGYLSTEHLDAVSYLMQIPSAKVSGVATFYHFFNFVKPGEHQISVCLGTACYVKGAGKILDRFSELLGIGVGETTGDGKFSIQSTRCLGMCALAPVAVVDEKVYGDMKPGNVEKILKEYGFDKKKK